MKKNSFIGKKMNLARLGTLMFCVLCLSACKPFVAKTECSSIDDIKAKQDFSIVLPEFIDGLSEQDYDVKYFVTRAMREDKAPEIVIGYIAELYSKNPEDTGYKILELGGTNVERTQNAIEPTNFMLSYENSHVQIKKEVSVPFDDKELMYSEYRAFNDADNQTQKKGLKPTTAPEDTEFDTFYAYIVHDGVRYSILLHGLPQEDPSVLETRCLDIVSETFKKLFN